MRGAVGIARCAAAQQPVRTRPEALRAWDAAYASISSATRARVSALGAETSRSALRQAISRQVGMI